MDCSEVVELIVNAVTALAVAAIAVVGGIWAFYRQKEFELVQRRYLDEGVDVVGSAAEAALSCYHHNWARCLEALKLFRDSDLTKPEELEGLFVPFPPVTFATAAHYRVRAIVNSDLVWETYQLVIAFAQTSNGIVAGEIPHALKAKLSTDQIEATREEIVAEAEKVLRDLDSKSHRYQVFIRELNRIAELLEGQKFSSKGIRRLHKSEVVRSALANLREGFKDKLDAHQGKGA